MLFDIYSNIIKIYIPKISLVFYDSKPKSIILFGKIVSSAFLADEAELL
jgi:hypothetical protein